MELAAEADQGPGEDRLQSKSMVIELLLRFGVASQKDLETTVKAIALHHVGSYSAANAVRCFEDQESSALLMESPRAAKPGQTGTDDQHIRRHLSTPMKSITGAK